MLTCADPLLRIPAGARFMRANGRDRVLGHDGGVSFTASASAQVEAHGFAPFPLQIWVSDDVNGDPYPEPVPIDGVSPWPL